SISLYGVASAAVCGKTRVSTRTQGVVMGFAAFVILTALAAEPAKQPTAEELRFFETAVRPVLAEHCDKCHGAKKQWANLRLDSREGLLKGGDSGPAIVPGNSKESLLIQAVKEP